MPIRRSNCNKQVLVGIKASNSGSWEVQYIQHVFVVDLREGFSRVRRTFDATDQYEVGLFVLLYIQASHSCKLPLCCVVV